MVSTQDFQIKNPALSLHFIIHSPPSSLLNPLLCGSLDYEPTALVLFAHFLS